MKGMSSSQLKKRDFGKRGFPSKCICGSNVCILTSKTQENPGRPFYRCETMRDEHLFKWVEDSMLEEMEDAIPKLENIEKEVSNLKFDVESLKEVIHEVKEEVIWIKVQMRKSKICCGFVTGIFVVVGVVYLYFV
ncbi:hypothetical protein N665_1906s0008 [Sinapis alba]|nr:hypothetical protein N665_1906s0008 [Sinapis alba]